MIINTLADIPAFYARQCPERVAISFCDKEVRYRELEQRGNQVANGLIAEGISEQGRIAIMDRNADTFFDIIFGSAKANTVTVTINFRLAAVEVEYILQDAEIELIFISEDYLALINEIRNKLPNLRKVIVLGESADNDESFGSWKNYFSSAVPAKKIAPESTALQMYTSGTTGHPKGVELSHASAIQAAAIGITCWPFLHEDNSTVLGTMPLFHLAAANLSIAALFVGARVVIVRDIRLEELTSILIDESISLVPLPPALIREMLNIPDIESRDFSCLKVILIAGSGIAVELLREAQDTFNCGFALSYGSTETDGGVTYLGPDECNPDAGKLLASAGRSIEDSEVKICDEMGKELSAGEIGEIVCRNSRLMKGYWKQPDKTAEVLRDGWYFSGDAGYVDEEGYLYVVDRIKDMIVSGGENIYPAEVEFALHQHPAISEAAVIGVPDPKWGEAVKAFIIVTYDNNINEKELDAFLRERIAGFKVPKSFEFVDHFPRNATGKVLKRAIRAPYWENHSKQVG